MTTKEWGSYRDTMALLTPTQGGQKMEIKEAGKL